VSTSGASIRPRVLESGQRVDFRAGGPEPVVLHPMLVAWVWVGVCACSSMAATKRSHTGSVSLRTRRSWAPSAARADASRPSFTVRHCATSCAPWGVKVYSTVRLSVAPGERHSMAALTMVFAKVLTEFAARRSRLARSPG